MGIGTSLFLIAVGAILDFAVTAQARGFNVNTVGVILMIVGAIGLVISLLFWNSWGGFGGYRRRSVEYREGPYAGDRTVVHDERTL
jgi:sulfite exporter TauE/SafE